MKEKSPIKQMFEGIGVKQDKRELERISVTVEKELLFPLKKAMGRNGITSRSQLINDLIRKWLEVKG